MPRGSRAGHARPFARRLRQRKRASSARSGARSSTACAISGLGRRGMMSPRHAAHCASVHILVNRSGPGRCKPGRGPRLTARLRGYGDGAFDPRRALLRLGHEDAARDFFCGGMPRSSSRTARWPCCGHRSRRGPGAGERQRRRVRLRRGRPVALTRGDDAIAPPCAVDACRSRGGRTWRSCARASANDRETAPAEPRGLLRPECRRRSATRAIRTSRRIRTGTTSGPTSATAARSKLRSGPGPCHDGRRNASRPPARRVPSPTCVASARDEHDAPSARRAARARRIGATSIPRRARSRLQPRRIGRRAPARHVAGATPFDRYLARVSKRARPRTNGGPGLRHGGRRLHAVRVARPSAATRATWGGSASGAPTRRWPTFYRDRRPRPAGTSGRRSSCMTRVSRVFLGDMPHGWVAFGPDPLGARSVRVRAREGNHLAGARGRRADGLARWVARLAIQNPAHALRPVELVDAARSGAAAIEFEMKAVAQPPPPGGITPARPVGAPMRGVDDRWQPHRGGASPVAIDLPHNRIAPLRIELAGSSRRWNRPICHPCHVLCRHRPRLLFAALAAQAAAT